MSSYTDTIREEDEEDSEEGGDNELFFDDSTNVDSDEDEVEEIMLHDQLPSPDEVKATVNPRKSRKRTSSSDLTTGALVLILSVMLATFLVCFFVFPQLWKDAQQVATHHTDGVQNTSAASTHASDPTPPMYPIEARVRSDIALRAGEEFNDPNSYQSKALEYLVLYEDVYDERSTSGLQQIYAIACFYFSTGGGSSWASRFDWLDGRNECTWAGLSCNAQRNIEQLNIDNGGLVGKLPDELMLLQELKLFDVEVNIGLTGEIPAFLGDMSLRKSLHEMNILTLRSPCTHYALFSLST